MIEIGNKYGIITVLEEVGRSEHYDKLYKCKCDCGNIFIRKSCIINYNIKRGYTNSCGCYKEGHARAMKRDSVRKHLSESAKKNADKTSERFTKLHDIADGTQYNKMANPSPRKDNKLGIKNICCFNGKYHVQIQMAQYKVRKSFDNLQDAIDYKESIYEEIINPAIENRKKFLTDSKN